MIRAVEYFTTDASSVKVNENDTFVPERKYQLVSRYNYRTVSKKGLYQRCKCIGDDTKDAAHRSPNCIKKTKKIKYG